MPPTLLPARIDNTYRGHILALWLFGLVVLVRTIQSVAVMVNGPFIIRSADGIPIDAFPANAAQTAVPLSHMTHAPRV